MKIATIPPVRVQLEFADQGRQLLGNGQTLSEFVARGLRSLKRARRVGGYLEADDVMRKLEGKLVAAKARKSAAHL
jgi:hypothetical protein